MHCHRPPEEITSILALIFVVRYAILVVTGALAMDMVFPRIDDRRIPSDVGAKRLDPHSVLSLNATSTESPGDYAFDSEIREFFGPTPPIQTAFAAR
jgi:hypothetical protein